jgi:uncharacterized protein with PIN domain
MPFPLSAGSTMHRRCQYCNESLRRIDLNPNSLGSPFSKSDPVYFCNKCDGPGRLPFDIPKVTP